MCPHCGADVEVSPGRVLLAPVKKQRVWPIALWIVGIGMAAAAAVVTFRSGPPSHAHDAGGQCLLTGDARFVEAMGDIVVQPPSGEEWTDVTLTLQGQGTGALNRGQSTGPFTLPLEVVKGRTAVKIDTFQKPSGERWVRMVMRPTDLNVVASVVGERCRLDKKF